MVLVTITWSDGDSQTLDLSIDAIKFYQDLGLEIIFVPDEPIPEPEPIPIPEPEPVPVEPPPDDMTIRDSMVVIFVITKSSMLKDGTANIELSLLPQTSFNTFWLNKPLTLFSQVSPIDLGAVDIIEQQVTIIDSITAVKAFVRFQTNLKRLKVDFFLRVQDTDIAKVVTLEMQEGTEPPPPLITGEVGIVKKAVGIFIALTTLSLLGSKK